MKKTASNTSSSPQNSRFIRILNIVEKIGNRLPHPATIFAILALAVIVFSFIAHVAGVTAIHPSEKTVIRPFNLISGAGLVYIFENVTRNFIMFPPFGIVLVSIVGIGLADGSGLIEALVKQTIVRAPRRFVTSMVIAAGILSHLGSSVGYVVLIPLGGMVFLAFKRHPVAGLSAAFFGVSGGFGANFLIGSIDPILAGLTESAARIIEPGITISPAVNYYFMFVSAVMIVIVGTFVTEKIVEPRLGTYNKQGEKLTELTETEKKGLRWALAAMGITVLLFMVLVIPSSGLLRGKGPALKGPFFKGIVTAIMIFFFIPGFIYGVITGKIKNDRDAVKLITEAIKGISPYIVLVFFASQFVFWFNKSNLGIILAIKGAGVIQSSGISGVLLMIIFIIFSGFMNMFMGSASAKWAIMAPVFVPMFMLSGYHPALTQAAFRIGDSVTNIITPMMSYFALILTYINKYDEDAGIGTIIATMLPYSIILSVIWSLLLIVWYLLGFPLGPGGPVNI